MISLRIYFLVYSLEAPLEMVQHFLGELRTKYRKISHIWLINAYNRFHKFYNCSVNGHQRQKNPDFLVCEQQKRSQACTSMQSDQGLWYSLPEKDFGQTANMLSFFILVSLCSWVGWFDSYLVSNPEDRLPRVAANFEISRCFRDDLMQWRTFHYT